jgi:hypothetical protein
MGSQSLGSKCITMNDAPTAQKPSDSALRFTFRIVGRGWLEADLQSPTQQARVTASYLSDSLPLLLSAFQRARVEGTRSEANWAEEPGHYRWEISPLRTSTRLRVFEAVDWDDETETIVFDYEGPTTDLELAVIEGCLELLNAMGEVRYFQRWGTRFPLAELRSLQKAAGLPVLGEQPPDANATPREPLRDELASRWNSVLRRQTSLEETNSWAARKLESGSHGKAVKTGLKVLSELSPEALEAPEEYQKAVQRYVIWATHEAQRHDDDPALWHEPARQLWRKLPKRRPGGSGRA